MISTNYSHLLRKSFVGTRFQIFQVNNNTNNNDERTINVTEKEVPKKHKCIWSVPSLKQGPAKGPDERLVWFYGISTIVGYLIPNPFLYI